MDNINITSFEELKAYAAGNVLELPEFAENQPFIARVRRPSLLVLAKSGKIPNRLMSAASELFISGSNGIDKDDDSILSDLYDIMKLIAEASLISPTMREIEEAGIELTDEQLMAIFNYSQNGARALETFRQE